MSRTPELLFHPAHEALGGSLLSRLAARLSDRFHRFAAINELEQLSDRQLRDIGVERRQIVELAQRQIADLRAR